MHTGYIYVLLGIECTHCVPCTEYLSQWAEGGNFVTACLDEITVKMEKLLLWLDELFLQRKKCPISELSLSFIDINIHFHISQKARPKRIHRARDWMKSKIIQCF